MTSTPDEPGIVGDTGLGVPGDPEPEVEEDDTHEPADEPDDAVGDDEPEEVEDGVEDDPGTEDTDGGS